MTHEFSTTTRVAEVGFYLSNHGHVQWLNNWNDLYNRAAGAFTNEREMHTTGKIYVTKYIYSGCSTLIEDNKTGSSPIALKIAG